MPRFAIIQAPSILGLRPTGVETLPDALFRNGLAERLHARIGARVSPEHAYDVQRDPATGMLNIAALAHYAPRLADEVGNVLDAGDWPVVLGGDCSILLGSTLGLRRRGRYGLLFLDGHADYYQAEANPNGEAASMDLALVTGRGPDPLTDLEGLRPLVREEDVAVLGYRDQEEQNSYGSQPLPVSILALDLASIRKEGARAAAELAIERLTRTDAEGFWIHLDADVLEDAFMPAVDYRIPDGLSPEELVEILRVAIGSGKAMGIEITISNPALDHTGESGARLTDIIVQGIGGRQ